MIKLKKLYFMITLGAFFLLSGILISTRGGDGLPFIYFGTGTWIATLLYYSVMVKHPQVTAFILGLIILHTGVVLIVKTNYPGEIGLVTFICGIMVLLNSGFSEYMKDRREQNLR